MDPEMPEIDELAISEANSVLKKPLNFYGSYLMQVMYKKNEVLTDAVVQHLMKVISQLQKEKQMMEVDKEAIVNVAALNFDLAQQDADRIKEQADQVLELNKIIDLNKKLVNQEKIQIYADMRKKYNALQKEYMQFRQMAEAEIQVNHNVIERQK